MAKEKADSEDEERTGWDGSCSVESSRKGEQWKDNKRWIAKTVKSEKIDRGHNSYTNNIGLTSMPWGEDGNDADTEKWCTWERV